MKSSIQSTIAERIESAENNYGPFTSTHEALGVVLEEWNELQSAIHANDRAAIDDEACDLAAALIRLSEQLRVGNESFLRRSGLVGRFSLEDAPDGVRVRYADAPMATLEGKPVDLRAAWPVVAVADSEGGEA